MALIKALSKKIILVKPIAQYTLITNVKADIETAYLSKKIKGITICCRILNLQKHETDTG